MRKYKVISEYGQAKGSFHFVEDEIKTYNYFDEVELALADMMSVGDIIEVFHGPVKYTILCVKDCPCPENRHGQAEPDLELPVVENTVDPKKIKHKCLVPIPETRKYEPMVFPNQPMSFKKSKWGNGKIFNRSCRCHDMMKHTGHLPSWVVVYG